MARTRNESAARGTRAALVLAERTRGGEDEDVRR